MYKVMKTNKQETINLEIPTIKAFKVKKLMAALELGYTDETILQFLNFLSNAVPIERAYFLHVIPPFGLFDHLLVKRPQPLADQYDLCEKVALQMESKVKEVIAKEPDINIEYDVFEGDPLEELLQNSAEVNADLTIIGQKTSTKSHGIFANRLARRLKSNALIIPDQAKPSMKKILVPVDFSPNAVKALQTAMAIKKQMKELVDIVCLHVYTMPDFSAYQISKSQDQFRQIIEKDRKAAFKLFIDNFAGDDREAVQTVLIEKDLPWIPHYIMSYARENEIDFVVMGAKGHSKIERLLMGSVTEKWLSINEHIPTLIVK